MNKAELLQELGVQGTKKTDPTLEKTEKALELLGNPQQDYNIILVGGTNGKGSTVEMISELLQSLDFNVGVNKSPHLESPTERIKVDSEEIAEERMKDYAEKIMEMKPDLSFFELMTVMAYKHFSDEEVDYAVVEVGMGGRLDATNAAENEVAVVTNVGLDHMKYLGETREEIAEEKAGIIPEEGELITGSEMEVLEKTAENRDTELRRPEKVEDKGEKLSYRGERFKIPVKGSFQAENLSTALKTVETVEKLPEDLESALEDLECPGRLEKIADDPEVILDGAHNLRAIKQLNKELESGFACVFNCTEKKEGGKMIEALEENAEKFIFTESEIEWSEDAETLEKKCSIDSEVEEDFEDAVEKAKTYVGDEGTVLVTGSLYLVGNVRSVLK